MSDEEKKSAECGLIFAVEGKSQAKGNPIFYTFTLYSGIVEIHDSKPVTDRVVKGHWKYYLFEAKCESCSILISLQSISNGDPDLYINKGDGNLPTIE